MNKSKAVEKMFLEREEFIIIAITGRTGSGCSTVTNLLCKNTIDIDDPDNHKQMSNDDRKYRIIHKFIKAKWHPFTKIQVSDIITSFLFQLDSQSFEECMQKASVYSGPIFQQHASLVGRIKPYYFFEQDVPPDQINIVYDFYYKDLPHFREELKKVLKERYTSIYQKWGENIRTYGEINLQDSTREGIFAIPERINKLIKLSREYNKKTKIKDYFVIDAFRNPMEALFFKQRYSAFYLIAINSPDKDRVNRLFRKKLNHDQIVDIDTVEYPKDKNNYAIINIQKCIEDADIHISNPDSKGDYLHLSRSLAKYISLIFHPGIITPTQTERCMQIAYTAKFNSGCISRQVGAVVSDQSFSVKSIGWNDAPFGHVPCLLRNAHHLMGHDDKPAYSDYELSCEEFINYCNQKFKLKSDIFRSMHYAYCFREVYNGYKEEKNQVHTRSLHAEENAFLQISKYGGGGVENGFLFTTASPCELCSKKAYQLGIKKIFYIDPYPGISQEHILGCGSNRPEMELFTGAIGRAYYNLYEPILPYKDELMLLLSSTEEN